MENSFLTIMNSPSSKIVRKHSVFEGSIAYVESREEAENFFNLVKSNSKGAAHNVWAYLIFQTNLAYCSDDGEPCKTAGEPVLNVLKKIGIFNVCVVITRYFGGVLLGTGGLVEAYSSACKSIFENVVYGKCCLCAQVQLIIDYGAYDRLKFLLNFFNAEVLSTNFAAKVTVNFLIEYCKFENFKASMHQKIGVDYICEIIEKNWNRLKISQCEVEEIRFRSKKFHK